MGFFYFLAMLIPPPAHPFSRIKEEAWGTLRLMRPRRGGLFVKVASSK